MQAPFVVTSVDVSVNELPHASDAVATANTGVAGQLIVVGAGSDAMTGAVISCTLMICEAVAVLPQPSSAVHVLVIVYSLGQEPFVVTSAEVNVGVPQLSVTVGVVQDGVPEHSILDGPGNPEMTGGIVSSTLIV